MRWSSSARSTSRSRTQLPASSLTDELNTQWRNQLKLVGSVFQNYLLIGTQWGASITSTPDPKVPSDGVPSFLSNSVAETYLQTMAKPEDPFGTGPA